MDDLIQDVRYGARLLWKHKTLSLAAILTLAVCLAANVAIFCLVNGVILRPLPFPEANRLVYIYNAYPRAGVLEGSTGVPDYFDRKGATDVFEEVAAFNQTGLTLGGHGEAERITVMRTTPSFFPLLRARPQIGRTFAEDDGVVGSERKIILGQGLWKRLFGGRSEALGQALRLNGEPYTVVGVMPGSFQFWSTEVDAWIPLAFTAEQKSDARRHNNSVTTIARLGPGITRDRAQQTVDALNRRSLDLLPGLKQTLLDVGYHSTVVNLQDYLVRDIRGSVFLLWGGALFLLLIGSVNIANLALVRASARQRELATRHALGAANGRLARQMITENVVLTLAGGVTGVLLGYWALEIIRTMGIDRLSRIAPIELDPIGIGYALVLMLAIGLVVGLAPLVTLRGRLLGALREEGRSGTASRGTRLARRVMVTAQVAFALILLAGAALLLQSFRAVLAVDPGFSVDRVWTGAVNLPETRYPDPGARRSFNERLLEGVRAIPGVTHAGTTNVIPLGGSTSDSVILAEGQEIRPGEALITVYQSVVSPGYFEAMRIRLLRGRLFGREDTASSRPVMVVDDRLAAHFWPGQDPIGKRMFLPSSTEDLRRGPGPDTRWLTVVGVVNSVKLRGVAMEEERLGAAYYPAAQDPRSGLVLAVSSSLDPAALTGAIRREVARIDAEMPVFNVRTMEERRDRAVADRRTPMMLAVVFGAIALFLAAVGLYGVLAYQVSQRQREIGIRMALGSSSAAIMALVLREGLLLVGIGASLGLAGTWVLGRAIASQLYQVQPFDPAAVVTAAAVLALAALVACLVPARRASRVNPVVALSDV